MMKYYYFICFRLKSFPLSQFILKNSIVNFIIEEKHSSLYYQSKIEVPWTVMKQLLFSNSKRIFPGQCDLILMQIMGNLIRNLSL